MASLWSILDMALDLWRSARQKLKDKVLTGGELRTGISQVIEAAFQVFNLGDEVILEVPQNDEGPAIVSKAMQPAYAKLETALADGVVKAAEIKEILKSLNAGVIDILGLEDKEICVID